MDYYYDDDGIERLSLIEKVSVSFTLDFSDKNILDKFVVPSRDYPDNEEDWVDYKNQVSIDCKFTEDVDESNLAALEKTQQVFEWYFSHYVHEILTEILNCKVSQEKWDKEAAERIDKYLKEHPEEVA